MQGRYRTCRGYYRRQSRLCRAGSLLCWMLIWMAHRANLEAGRVRWLVRPFELEIESKPVGNALSRKRTVFDSSAVTVCTIYYVLCDMNSSEPSHQDDWLARWTS